MIFAKANSDLILLILLVLRIELDSNIIRYRSWNREPVSRSVRLGSTSAYTQISLPLQYPHPKSLQQNELDENILFSRLNYFNSIQQDRFIAWILHPPDHETPNPPDDVVTPDPNVAPRQNVPDINGGAVSDLSSGTGTLELTREDMDLIEILWKQDIDLGVSRDAYDSRQTIDVDKLKDIEFIQEKEFFDQKDVKPYEEPILVPDPLAGLNYTIDSETGEYVFDELSKSQELNTSLHLFPDDDSYLTDKNKGFENDLLKEAESLASAINLDTFLPFDDDNNFRDLNEWFSSNEISDLMPDLAPNPNYFLPPVDEGEKDFEDFRFLNETSEIDLTRGEMYPPTEDCWSDTTTMMSLIPLNNSYQGSLTPVQSPPSLNTPAHLSTEGFTLESSVPSSESDYQPISSSIGSSSIGYAVAESIALTNDSDPVPTGSVTNSIYGADLPELLYSNHTVAVSQDELIPDLFLDEELQLMTLPTNDNEEKPREDHMDTSCDSVSSGNLASASDYENGSFSDTHFQQINCNDQQYFTLKTYYSDPSENSACAISCGIMNFNKKFDYPLPKTPAYNCSNFLQHNHTYHMPFSNGDTHHKVIARDKQNSLSDDDICNKDEKRAKELKLPISIADIINLAIDEYNERLSKYELTEAQITLIRDIRRRGKNKVAAQNCRKRKMDQINTLQQDLDFLQSERLKLKSKQNHLLQQKHLLKEKYVQLYDLILRSTNSRPPNTPSHLSSSNNSRTTSEALFSNVDPNLSGGARTKRKFKK